MGEKEEVKTIKDIKKEEKVREYQEKIDEKRRKKEEKIAKKEEKERIKNSFGRKIRNFFLTIIFVIILLIAAFFGARYYLGLKEEEIITKQSEKYYDKGCEYYDNGEYDKALKEFDKIDSDYKDYDDVTSKVKKVRLAIIDEKVDKLASKENYIGILEYLNENVEDGKDIKDTIEEYQEKYKDLLIDQVKEEMKTDIDSAREKVKTARNILDDDKELKALSEEIDEYETTEITKKQGEDLLKILEKRKENNEVVSENQE